MYDKYNTEVPRLPPHPAFVSWRSCRIYDGLSVRDGANAPSGPSVVPDLVEDTDPRWTGFPNPVQTFDRGTSLLAFGGWLILFGL